MTTTEHPAFRAAWELVAEGEIAYCAHCGDVAPCPTAIERHVCEPPWCTPEHCRLVHEREQALAWKARNEGGQLGDD